MKKLRIAILHHHLRGGGVTRVIERTFEVLQSSVELCVIVGEQPSQTLNITPEHIGVVEGMSYGAKNPERAAETMFREVKEQAADLLGGRPDVWHIHNHSLGKNAAATRVFLKLAAESQTPVLFHIHDFAEDNRPKNYQYLADVSGFFGKKNLVEELYPQAPHIHYGVLNGRDYAYLSKAGVDEERLHVLSNPVALDVSEQDVTANPVPGKMYLYPCRVIPRKNIGEFVLWAALAEGDEYFAVTLAPKNPKYHEGYTKWKQFVEDHDLPVIFEAGKAWDMSFPELLNRADAFVSTSISEGFGLIYLESWLAAKPLLGRILPDIVADFKNKGLQFPGMYKRLYVPASWPGKEVLKERYRAAISTNRQKYGMDISQEELGIWLEHLMPDGRVDFGTLDEELQRTVIKKILAEPALAEKINPNKVTHNAAGIETIQANKAIVKKEFSTEKYGARLLAVYRALAHTKPEKPEFLQAVHLLQAFQSPQNFSLIRT